MSSDPRFPEFQNVFRKEFSVSKTKTSVVKYKHKMQGGMPVHFPVCSKSMSGITHHKVANPYLELTQEEADLLVSTDPHNFEHADPADYKAWQKSGGKHADPIQNPRHVPATAPAPADASDAPESDADQVEDDAAPEGESEPLAEETQPTEPAPAAEETAPVEEPKPAKAKKPRGGKKAAAPKTPKSSRKGKGKAQAAPEAKGE
jgi:hypothetical protein